jgi:hypothetical protein
MIFQTVVSEQILVRQTLFIGTRTQLKQNSKKINKDKQLKNSKNINKDKNLTQEIEHVTYIHSYAALLGTLCSLSLLLASYSK